MGVFAGRAEGPGAGERAMIAALLLDAQNCARGEYGERQHDRAWWWIDGGEAAIPFTAACRELDIDPDRVRRILLPHRPRRSFTRSSSSRFNPEDLIRLVDEGKTLTEAARQLRISLSHASKITKSYTQKRKQERDTEIRKL